jgi:hypothetical protein
LLEISEASANTVPFLHRHLWPEGKNKIAGSFFTCNLTAFSFTSGLKLEEQKTPEVSPRQILMPTF